MSNSIIAIPEVGRAAAGVISNIALVRTAAVAVTVQVSGNGCTRLLLTQYWLNVRVLNEGHEQTSQLT